MNAAVVVPESISTEPASATMRAAMRRDRRLAVDILLAALLDRGLHHAAPCRAAMHDVEMALVGEQLQVATDGLVRHPEHVGELADAHRTGRAQALHDLIMTAYGERTNHGDPIRISICGM